MKIVRFLLVAAILVASGIISIHQEPVEARCAAFTCADLNRPMYDGLYRRWFGLGIHAAWEFKAGDTINLVANWPAPPGFKDESGADREPALGGSLVIALLMNNGMVKSEPFPGQLSYTFTSDTSIPAGGFPSLSWAFQRAGIPMDEREANFLFWRAQWDVSCSPGKPAASTETVTTVEPVPGCDLGMELTPNAAVGTFVWDTDVYWAPDANATTGITMPAGKTAWVLGMDETGAFYKFIWSCTILWAPVNTIGPNYDAVWNGTPLPTTVVE